jgi:hypothetical protein
MLSTAFTPISPPSEDMFCSTISARCTGGHSTCQGPFGDLCSMRMYPSRPGLSCQSAEGPSMEEPLNGEIESCQFSKRKSTACETELEFSSEHSQDSQPDHLSKPQRKQSLLANLPAPSSKQFETIILEESDSEEVEFLGKRSVPAASQQQTILEPAPEKHTATTQSKSQEEHIFTLSCQFGHKSTVLGEVHHAEENWCMTCRNLLGDLRKFAEERGGKCVTTILAPEVTFECGLGHQWTVAYKKATKGWCKDCKAKKKVLLKEMLHRENVRADEERKQRQNQLLEESRQRMLANEKNQREYLLY